METREADSDELLNSLGAGDADAEAALFARHRDRLKRMVARRLDRRLAARLDPSDVVQEVYAKAHQRLPGYLATRPIPFYTWLRQLAVEHISKLHEWHMRTQKRGIGREVPQLPADSAAELAEHLAVQSEGPSERLQNRESRAAVQAALLQLREMDREVLLLRFVEDLSIQEIAAVLDLSPSAVKQRQARALLRLKSLLREI